MPESTKTFLDQLGSSFASTVSQLIGCEVNYAVDADQGAPPPQLWCTSQLHGLPSCKLAIGISRETGLVLARAMLSEAPGEAADLSPEDQELLAEFWKQALGRASTDLKALLKDEALDYVDTQAPAWEPAVSATIDLQSQKANASFRVKLSAEIVQSLSAANTVPENVEGAQDAAAANNLDLLLDVPLSVTLRFGQRAMALREILQLTSGSVVELDRQAEDAVDLLLEERLIARGQVVVVDGCYGLRVTEVVR